MKIKAALLSGLLALVFACSTELNETGTRKEAPTLTIHSDTLSGIFNRCLLRSAIIHKGSFKLVIEDPASRVSSLYDVQKHRITDTLQIPSESISRRLSISSLLPYAEWLNSDSLAFSDLYVPEGSPEYFRIYSIKQDSIVYSVPTYMDSSFGLDKLSFALYAYSPPMLPDSHQIVGVAVDLSEPTSTHHEQMKLATINAKDSGTSIFDVGFPADAGTGNYGFLKEFYLTWSDSICILSTSVSNEVTIYNINTGEFRTRDASSRFYEPFGKTGTGTSDFLEQQRVTEFYYLNLWYDPYRELFYRGYMKKLPEKSAPGHYTTYTDKETGMVVFDKDLNKLGEYHLGKIGYSAFIYYTAITPVGLHILCKPNNNTFILNTYAFD